MNNRLQHRYIFIVLCCRLINTSNSFLYCIISFQYLVDFSLSYYHLYHILFISHFLIIYNLFYIIFFHIMSYLIHIFSYFISYLDFSLCTIYNCERDVHNTAQLHIYLCNCHNLVRLPHGKINKIVKKIVDCPVISVLSSEYISMTASKLIYLSLLPRFINLSDIIE